MRKNITKMFLALMLVAGSATLLSACNTTQGLGKDMSAAGDAIADSAERNKGD